MPKKLISTSHWSEEQPCAGQNTQHSISIFRFVPAVDGQWGTLINSETKEFNGMIGMVNRKVKIKIDFIWPCYFHFEIHVNFLFNWPIGII